MKEIKGKLYLTVAFSLAGTSVITGRILGGTLGSFTITAVSLAIVLLCLLPFWGKETMKTMGMLSKSDWLLIVFQAIFGIFLFRAFLLFGLGLTSTVEAGILTGTTPAVTALLAFFFIKEKLSRWGVLGILCTAAGIVLLQQSNLASLHFSARHALGNVLILCAAASESTFNILSRKHQLRAQRQSLVEIHPLVQTLLVSAIALILSLVPAVLENPLPALGKLGWKEVLALCWYGLGVTALAFVFFYSGVRRCDAYTTAAFSGMMPLSSMLLSLVLLREPIGLLQWAGGALVILSMALMGRGSPGAPKIPAEVSPFKPRQQKGNG